VRTEAAGRTATGGTGFHLLADQLGTSLRRTIGRLRPMVLVEARRPLTDPTEGLGA
jgi:hypothetical protein